MRNEEGTYIGVPDCKHYIDIARYGVKKCCGGKGEGKISFIRCSLKGELEAEISCTMFACEDYDGKQGRHGNHG